MIHSLILESPETKSFVLACSYEKKVLEIIRNLLIKSYHRSNLLDGDIPNEIFLPKSLYDLMKDNLDSFQSASCELPNESTLLIKSEVPLEQCLKDLQESLREYL